MRLTISLFLVPDAFLDELQNNLILNGLFY